MQFLLFKQDLKSLNKILSILFALCIFLAISNVLLVLFSIHQSKKAWVLVTPPVVTMPFKINQLEVDSDYLQQMSLFFLSERLNVSSETVLQNHALLLKFLATEYYSSIEDTFKKEEKAIMDGKISSTFFVKKIQVDPKNLSALVEGTLSLFSGKEFISEEPKSYSLQYTYENGRLLIKTFSEGTHD